MLVSTSASCNMSFTHWAILCEDTGLWGLTYDRNRESGVSILCSQNSNVFSSYCWRHSTTQSHLSPGKAPKKLSLGGAPTFLFFVRLGNLKRTPSGLYTLYPKVQLADQVLKHFRNLSCAGIMRLRWPGIVDSPR